MGWRTALAALLMSAQAALAQGWTAEITRDAVYDAARMSLPTNVMVIACASPTGRATVTPDSRWWEVSVAPPWHYLLVFSDAMVPQAGSAQQVEMILFADQTGYRLPPVARNELEGGWQVILPMIDPVFKAAGGASKLVLQVDAGTAWELPVAGFAAGLKETRDLCVSAWNASGLATPAGISDGSVTPAATPAAPAAAGAFTLPPQIQAHVNAKCNGIATIKPEALQAGDIDGDAVPDVVLNWRDVRCLGGGLNPFCGAANCSIETFMSSRGYAQPVDLLGTGAALVDLGNGRFGIGLSGSYSLCSAGSCDTPWIWNGSTLVQSSP